MIIAICTRTEWKTSCCVDITIVMNKMPLTQLYFITWYEAICFSLKKKAIIRQSIVKFVQARK
jgi:hypothetical protein